MFKLQKSLKLGSISIVSPHGFGSLFEMFQLRGSFVQFRFQSGNMCLESSYVLFRRLRQIVQQGAKRRGSQI